VELDHLINNPVGKANGKSYKGMMWDRFLGWKYLVLIATKYKELSNS
jgi:hypothetical protein